MLRIFAIHTFILIPNICVEAILLAIKKKLLHLEYVIVATDGFHQELIMLEREGECRTSVGSIKHTA